MEYVEEKLLIVTKTYPNPSSNYRETSCIAAINENGEMRRLFPVPYRLLDGSKQFERWQWIQARIFRSSDKRPESYRVDTDSITPLNKLQTKHGWTERLEWIEPHLLSSFAELEDRRVASNQSLGFVRPLKFSLVIEKAEDDDWPSDKKIYLNMEGFFDTQEVKNRPPLRKVPFGFYYQYECQSQSGPQVYKHKITDWEISMLFWHCYDKDPLNWERPFRQKLEDDFSTKNDIILMLGTMHRWRDKWLIIGVVYPPKSLAKQPMLFRSGPNV